MFCHELYLLLTEEYDHVVLVGALCDGHVTTDCFSCFREIIRILKPGKYLDLI